MNKIEDRLKKQLEQLSELEVQLKDAQDTLGEENRKIWQIDKYEEANKSLSKKIKDMSEVKEKLMKKRAKIKKSESICNRLVWPILILGSVTSALLILKSFRALLIGYTITICLTGVVMALSINLSSKHWEVTVKINEQIERIKIAKENILDKEKALEKLKETLMEKTKKELVSIDAQNIKDNIAYIEESIWNILQGINPEDDTEYTREVRECFYPKLFVPNKNEKVIKLEM